MIRKVSWQGLVLLFFAGWVFLYGDRTILAPALAGIGEEWRLSSAELGLISSTFFFTYTAFQIPSAMLADRLGRKAVLVPGYLLFSLTTALMGSARSYDMMLLWSALGGLGQSTYYAAQYSLSSEVVPSKHLGLGSAVINSGMAVGSSLGLLVASWLGRLSGASWRLPFWVMAVPTALVGLAIALLVPEEGRRMVAPVVRDGQRDRGKSGEGVGLHVGGRRVGNLVLLLMATANFCSLYGFFLVLTWLPYYLQTVRGLSNSMAGWVASLVWWFSIPSALLFSGLSDRFVSRRATVMGLMVVAGLALALIPYASTQGQLIAVLVLYGVTGKLTVDPIIVAFLAESLPKGASAGAFGFINFAGMLGSVLAPVVTGLILDAHGRFAWAFWIGALILGFGVLCVLLTFLYQGVAVAPRPEPTLIVQPPRSKA